MPALWAHVQGCCQELHDDANVEHRFWCQRTREARRTDDTVVADAHGFPVPAFYVRACWTASEVLKYDEGEVLCVVRSQWDFMRE